MPLGTMPGRTWFLIGAKGGAGTTVVTTSLAWALAESGLHVVVLDLDLRGGQAAMHLCERNAGPTLQDALQVVDRLDTVLLDTLLTRCSPRLRLLPAPRGADNAAEAHPQAVRQVAERAAELADVVLLDVPARGLPWPDWAEWLQAADHRVVVTTPSLSAAYNTRRTLEQLRRCTDGPCEIVVNQVGRQDRLKPAELRQALGAAAGPLTWRELPRRDATVDQAVHQGLAVGQLAPHDPLARALGRWAAEVARPPAGAPGAHGDPGSRGGHRLRTLRQDVSHWMQNWSLKR